jgi:hypothetical protein
MKNVERLLAIFFLSVAFSPASAADPAFLPGLRIAMTPLVGLVPSKAFSGFETEDHSVKVLMTELPASAYAEVDSTLRTNPDYAGANGVKPEPLTTGAGKAFFTAESATDGKSTVRRYSMILPGGAFSGYVAVQVPENATKIYSDDAVRQMFSTAVVRKEVPVDEQLALFPFKLSDLSAFKTVRTLTPGAAILLADSSDDTNVESAAFMVIGSIGSAPAQPDDRGRFAQQAATMIPGLRDARITMSEPIRIEGSPGYETRVDATSGKDNTPVTVVQWLRFGSASAALRIIASSPRDEWTKAFPRFRAVRDGIQAR